MIDKITIGAAQLGPSCIKSDKIDKEGNVLRILSLLEQAVQKGAKIVCFPELSLTDYFPTRIIADYEQYFDQVPNDLTRDIVSFTRKHSISVILPHAEFDGVAFYNSASIIDRGEVVGRYRKVHLPGLLVDPDLGVVITHESHYFTPGNLGFPIFELQGVKVGVLICYDRTFPETYRTLALKGAQIVFNPTNVGYRGLAWRRTTWETILTTRAFENNLFVVGVNKGGSENGLEFAGDSMILNPIGGTVMAKSQTKGDELLVAELDLNDIIVARKQLPVFRDRRPSLYF